MLATNEVWGKLRTTDRDAILAAAGLAEPTKPDVSTDERLLELLDRRPLATLRTEVDAVPGRTAQAIEHAAKLLEPKVRPVTIERATLRSEEDVDVWLARQKTALLQALKDGPVLTQ